LRKGVDNSVAKVHPRRAMNSVKRRGFIFNLDSVFISVMIVEIENSGYGIVGNCSLDGLEFDGS
jgi:hypothetical protein